MDAFAVAIATGFSIGRMKTAQVSRLSFAFGMFQFLMPLVGWFVGREVARLIGAFDHWIAFGLLAFVGGKMLWEDRRGKESGNKGDPTSGMMLLVLSLATSIDALAVGLSLAFLRVPILIPSLVIGVVTSTLTAAGAVSGSRIGQKWGVLAEAAGGCVLLTIGSRILITHLAG